ncbi:hypothetical protein PRZ48_010541 [Zasmidium cellare]|uniref:Cupin type-1 domain-containing protein n=1 Tax=Zasmidium cellare TaxID=395010 RepID=A0ABR0E9G8_ZASCE|nr:hypothetical protein PRZ48_010541 [Zasmidium cellare]
MFRQFPLFFGICLMAALERTTAAIDVTQDPTLIAKLSNAASQLDRLQYLSEDSAWVFDYKKQGYFWNTRPGGVVNANVNTFPASFGNEMTMAWINLGPCCMLTPHFHPRAVNWVTAISGNTTTYMIEENGAHTVKTQLDFGKSTVFPRGSVHSMVNQACEDAILISALSNPDAGTMNLNQVFNAGIPTDELNAAFGFNNFINDNTKNGIPEIGTGANWGTDECLARCGINKDDSPPSPSFNGSALNMRRP